MTSHKIVLHIKQGLNYKTKREESRMGLNRRLKGIELGHVPQGVSLLAVAVYRLARSLRSQVTTVVAREEGIRLVSWRIVMGLSEVEEATQKELIEYSRMEQAQVSRALKEMLDQGLIGTRPSTTDRRTRLFFLTDRGRAKQQALLPRVAHLSNAIDQALSPEEQLQFLEMCLRIEHAANGAVAELNDVEPDGATPATQSFPEEVGT
jgi:DNA-binding MarR family transcriptional regulator